MEKLMYMFLDSLNPDIFILKTKFGTLPHYSRGGSYLIGDEKRRQILLLCEFFPCEYDFGLSIYDKWLKTKPVCIRLKDTFIPIEYEETDV